MNYFIYGGVLRKLCFGIFLVFVSVYKGQGQELWQYYSHTNFEKYQASNEKIKLQPIDENRVVFMGNSITEVWPILRPTFFSESKYIGRGISGQTTPQMLLRFRKDVIELNPKVVVILAGINDIAQNTGFTAIESIAENIMSMAELAKSHGIEVVICSVLPAIDFPWSPGLEPVNKVIELNSILESYAKANSLIYVDYHTVMKDQNNGLKVPEYTTAEDLVHPNEAGYLVMESLIQPAIEKALKISALSVSPLFTDHMVLQQNENVTIWGKASPDSHINVSGSWGQSSSTKTDNDGSWKLDILTPKAGGPYRLNIASGNENIPIEDVMIGEVWLASGQSNMSMPLKGWPPSDPILNSEEEIANANYPYIRMFKVANKYSLNEEETYEGQWDVCNPEKARDYSATGYFFAKRLHEELDVPIGIIHSSWGGTPAEAWTSKSEIMKLGDFDDMIAILEDPEREEKSNEWLDQWDYTPVPSDPQEWNDLELLNNSISQPEYNTKDWSIIQLPGRVDLLKDKGIDGVFWFRKTIELEDLYNSYNFEMGITDDTDVVYINGQKIGATTYDFTHSRKYPIPMSALKKGKNVISIRIVDTGGPGSISSEIKLTSETTDDISLVGEWDYAVTAELYDNKIYQYDLEKLNLAERPNILSPSPYSTPSCLYNAMIHPLLSYDIKGAVWYQGESNVGRTEQYGRLFPTMINDWRANWNSNFPFYFVQIAPYQYNSSGDYKLDESQKLRDAQRSALSVENTGMVVTLDIGNNKNIHPANKQEVGSRLAGLALAHDYDRNIVASGPLFKSQKIKGNKIYIEFDNIGTGLMFKEADLLGFEIAGSDKVFVTADANIKGKKVKVSSNSISKPMYVRYAWRDTSEATLFNKEGLPASSFSTLE